MVQFEASRLDGKALEWAVAKSLNLIDPELELIDPLLSIPACWSPHLDWADGGPLIEDLGINLQLISERIWVAGTEMEYGDIVQPSGTASSPLVAVCRAIVAAKFGEFVKVPAALVPEATQPG